MRSGACPTPPHHAGFTCEADTLGNHGYVYICIYSAASMGATPDVRNSQS
ncbi:type IV toxin-antitoxin system YeeU family antitoxin [Aeromonas rivuli]|nr:type IV toxin-antitoxin system YeeU family antitoxin [Aeromonas rivuli]